MKKEIEESSKGSLNQAPHEQKSELPAILHQPQQPNFLKAIETLLQKLTIDFKKESEENRQRFESLEGKVDKIDEENRQIFESLERKVDKIDENTKGLEKKVDQLGNKVQYIQAQFQDRKQREETRYKQTHQKFEAQTKVLEEGFTLVMQNVAELHVSVNSKGIELQLQFQKQFQSISQDITMLRDTAGQLLEQLLYLQTEVPQSHRNYGNELKTTKQSVLQIQSELDRVKSEVSSLRKEETSSDCNQKPEPKIQE